LFPHLECGVTGERYGADQLQGLSRVGQPLLVRYDLDGLRSALSKEKLAWRPEHAASGTMPSSGVMSDVDALFGKRS